MKKLAYKIGKTEKEVKALYLSAIDTFIHFGATEEAAREMAKETFRDTLGL